MKNTDLIIFSGQSNMQGQTEGLPKNNLPIDGALEYRLIGDELVPLKNPVGENLDINGQLFEPNFNDIPGTIDKSVLLGAWENHANMVPSFCKNYISTTGRNVIAVHAAKGSTTIDYWLKGNIGYDFIVKKSLSGIKKVEPEHIFFVWLQGESDALASVSKDDYKQKILSLNKELKQDIGIEKFGIILVGKFACDIRDKYISDAQKEVCAECDDFLLLTSVTEKLTEQPEFMNPFAFGHFSISGQEFIGKEAGHSLGNYLLNNR